MVTLEHYTEIVRLRQRQVLTRWARGHLPGVRTSTTRWMDLFVFFLEEIGAKQLLATFPDARLRRTLGIDFFAATRLFKAILKANASDWPRYPRTGRSCTCSR